MASRNAADSDLFEVEQILRKSKSSNGVIIYRVRWKGYGPDDDTWEPRQNLESCQDLIVEFERKQSALAKKRAEQRRANKALQEERVVECESSDESNGVYPSTFKNSFWKELEAGRVDLFGNDMYSKVKAKRSATHSKTDSSNSDEGQSTPNHKSRLTSSHQNKLQTSSQKRSSTGCSRSRKLSATSEYNKPDSVKFLSDIETDENCDSLFNNSNMNTNTTNKGSSDSDINAVTEGVDDVKFAETSPVASPSYTLLPKTRERKEISSKKKKKKGHKHKKFNKKRKTPDRNDRKRKLSCTSLTEDINEHCAKGRKLDDERSRGSLESGDIEEVCESDLRLECKDNAVDDSGIIDTALDNDDTVNSVKDKLDESSPAASSSVQDESSSPDLNLDYSYTPPPCSNSPASLFKDVSSVKVDSVDSGRGSSVSASDISVQTPGETDSSVFTNFTDSVSSVEAARKNSDAFDSGLCSPVSERGSVMIGRDSKPKTETYAEPLPAALSGGLKSSNKGRDQDLEIDLDDLDWELFDREVSMEPINISNFEFAESVRASNYEIVKRALKGDSKYNMNAPDLEGKTLLMHTVQQGNDHISDLLIENGADINAQTHQGLTPLMIACQCAEVSTVNLLLELGAKINMAASDGRTALITAAKRGHTLILWLLLECGANFNMVTVNGHNVMDYIKHLQHTEMENMLANHIHRVMSEFNKQVSITMNQTAKIVSALFPPQLYNVCDGDKFEYTFHHNLLPPNSGMGYLLFIGQAVFTSEEVQCRLYGPCAVKSVFLNGHQQSELTEGGNFVLAFSPLVNGRNVITINTVKAQEAKAKLIMCAYKAQILEM